MVLNGLEKLNIISAETHESFILKMENFDLEEFLKHYHFNSVLPDSVITKIGELITGKTLKNILSVMMLYKIFAPLRYLLTLSMTRLVIIVFKRQGIIPKQPPPGTSVKEIYVEQRDKLQKRVQNQRERYERSKNRISPRRPKNGNK